MSPARPQVADDEPNDRYGYSCYVLLIPAPAEIIDAQQAIWRRYPSPRTAIPAHITVKGTFVQITDFDELLERVQEVMTGVQQFWISFENAEVEWREKAGVLVAPVFQEIQNLHDRLVQEISPISKLRYPDDPYQVHMSLTSNYDPEELLEVESAFDEFDPGSGFQATAVELWARVGPSVGGKWGFMKRYPLLT
jgi:hypothetical protein